MTEKQKEITAEEAGRIVEAERDRRLKSCEAKIQRALQEHRCRLVALPRFIEDGNGGWRIVTLVQIQADQ